MTDVYKVTSDKEKIEKDCLFVVFHNKKCMMKLPEVMTRINKTRQFFCASQMEVVDAKCLYRVKEQIKK